MGRLLDGICGFLGSAKRWARRAVFFVQKSIARVVPSLVRTDRARYRLLQRPGTFGSGIQSSRLRLDIVYLALESDLNSLEVSLASVRKFLRHEIGDIHVVSPVSDRIREFCAEHSCVWHEETGVLGFGAAGLHLRVGTKDRSGWLFQQLIKLHADRISSSAHALLLDADTVLLGPQVFEKDGRMVLLVGDEYHAPYFQAYRKLLKRNPVKDFSFVTHQMIVDCGKLPALRKEMEQKGDGRPWWQLIVDAYDRTQISGFSEYETLGNWMAERFPEAVEFEYWFNRAEPRRRLAPLEVLEARYGQGLRSVSFHHYLR